MYTSRIPDPIDLSSVFVFPTIVGSFNLVYLHRILYLEKSIFVNMGESLRLILVLIPIIAGAISVFFSFQMMKRYDVPFANSYFYYLVFLYIFGTYSLAGSGILEYLLGRMETEDRVIHSARLWAILLGIPFLVLSKFMLVRSLTEFFRRSITGVITVIYFTLGILAFLAYGFFVVRLSRFNQGDFQLLLSVQRWVFFGFTAVMYLAAYIVVFFFSRNMRNHAEKRFIRIFVSWYLLYMVLVCTPLALFHLYDLFPHILVMILLSWHLIPILFLSIYLEKYHNKASVLPMSFEEKLTLFTAKYEISKREKEVIHLICKGLTNQEIGDTLFISLQTVKDHTHRIFLKTGVKNRVQLTNLIRSV